MKLSEYFTVHMPRMYHFSTHNSNICGTRVWIVLQKYERHNGPAHYVRSFVRSCYEYTRVYSHSTKILYVTYSEQECARYFAAELRFYFACSRIQNMYLCFPCLFPPEIYRHRSHRRDSYESTEIIRNTRQPGHPIKNKLSPGWRFDLRSICSFSFHTFMVVQIFTAE